MWVPSGAGAALPALSQPLTVHTIHASLKGAAIGRVKDGPVSVEWRPKPRKSRCWMWTAGQSTLFVWPKACVGAFAGGLSQVPSLVQLLATVRMEPFKGSVRPETDLPPQLWHHIILLSRSRCPNALASERRRGGLCVLLRYPVDRDGSAGGVCLSIAGLLSVTYHESKTFPRSLIGLGDDVAWYREIRRCCLNSQPPSFCAALP